MLAKHEKLTDVRIAIVATDGFEEDELFKPKKALEEAGATIEVVSLEHGLIRAWSDGNWGSSLFVDQIIEDATATDYDAVLLPGGVINADKLRMNGKVVKFVTDMIDRGKPVAAICHAPWILIEAGAVNDRIMTSWPSLKTDLKNAGADWVNEEVVNDNGLITSRKPADIPAFNREMIEEFSQNMSSSERERPIIGSTEELRQ